MRIFQSLFLALGLLGILGCGAMKDTTPKKEFPGGEPYQVDQPHNIPGTDSEAGEKPAQPEVQIPNKREEGGLVLGMNIEPKQIPAGAPVKVRMALRNMTSNSRQIRYSSEQRFDVAVFSDPDQKNLVHLWSADKMFGQMTSEFMLGPGSNVSRTLEIPTTGDTATAEMMGRELNQSLAPGYYYIWGTHEGEPLLSVGPIEIAVTE